MKMSEHGVTNLALALSKFQEEVRNPANTATNPQFRSKYAPLDVVINTVKPILAKHGLSFVQSTGAEGESITVKTLLLHETGEWIESDPLTLPAYQIKRGGEKEFNAQGAGSSLTYARRYSLSAMLGLSSEDDDDANGQVFGGGNGGYKDGSDNPPKSNGGGVSDEERERRRQEAIEKAKAKANAGNANDNKETPSEESTGASVEKANAGQLRAVDNLLNIVKRKNESFDRGEYLSKVLAEYGVAELEDVSSEQVKDLIQKLNAEIRKA